MGIRQMPVTEEPFSMLLYLIFRVRPVQVIVPNPLPIGAANHSGCCVSPEAWGPGPGAADSRCVPFSVAEKGSRVKSTIIRC